MANMTYGDLTTYANLGTYGFESGGSGSGSGSGTGEGSASCVWSSENVATVLSALSDLQTTVNAIKAKTDNLPASPAATGDAMSLTAHYNAAKNAASGSSVLELKSAVSALQTSVNAIPTTAAPTAQTIWEYATRSLTASPTDISGLATASALSTLQTSVNAIPTTSAPTAQNIWEYSSRTLTSGGGGNSGITAADVWSYTTRSLTASPTDISGLATASAVSSMQGDVTAIKAKTDGIPDGLGTILNKIYSLIAHWSVSGNTLTIYDSQNNTLGTFTLTKNVEGDITGVH